MKCANLNRQVLWSWLNNKLKRLSLQIWNMNCKKSLRWTSSWSPPRTVWRKLLCKRTKKSLNSRPIKQTCRNSLLQTRPSTRQKLRNSRSKTEYQSRWGSNWKPKSKASSDNLRSNQVKFRRSKANTNLESWSFQRNCPRSKHKPPQNRQIQAK